MFTSIIKEFLGAKLLMKYVYIAKQQNGNKIAAQKELGRISGNINLNHTGYTHLLATK